ncbi:MAG: type III PLP-dependent enzyme [Solirubrobacterales bacterium]
MSQLFHSSAAVARRLQASRRPVRAALPGRIATGLPTVDDIVRRELPAVPLHCLRPAALTEQAERFVAQFPGRVLYAVKCNPEPAVLRALWLGGVREFDCASAQEVRLVRALLPDATIHFMHPVKSRAAIRESWQVHGVRDFVVDSADEIAKVLEETGAGLRDLGLVVRLALPKGGAVYDLSGKFGAEAAEAVRLLRLARAVSRRVGLSFHVGSQCLDPDAYRRAIALAGRVVAEARVKLDVLDVGGGFPVAYPDVTPPPIEDFVAAITEATAAIGLSPDTELWCEPGRALAAPGQSLVVQVQARRDNELFISDGIYGSLSDAGPLGFRFPCRLIRIEGDAPSTTLAPFAFYGPTCDSADRMAGPFLLPEDIREGDWIEIGQLGAYGTCLRTGFNGFDQASLIEVADRPLIEPVARPPAAIRAA